MEPNSGKPSFLRNILVRLFLFCVFVIALRSAYVVTIRGESCDVADFCFFAFSANVDVGEDLMSEAVLSPNFKTLCIDTPTGADVFALRELGVEDSIGISKKGFKPLVVPGQGSNQPFSDSTFDFVFCGGGAVEKSTKLGDFAAETQRTMKPEGCFWSSTRWVGVVGTAGWSQFRRQLLELDCSLMDDWGIRSCCMVCVVILDVLDTCECFEASRFYYNSSCNVMDPSVIDVACAALNGLKVGDKTLTVRCATVSGQLKPKHEYWKQPPTSVEIPTKVLCLTEVVTTDELMDDGDFKPRYVYVDVGARSYGLSIVSWFKKQYPKQNKTFEIYAIEADKTFHGDYKLKKGVTLLPYATWVRNESLFFEINEDPSHKEVEKGRGMGRIQPVQASGGGSASSSNVYQIQGFDFADWL
ncbi:hypothetical protein SASPL_111932 [Salvia splendens]|uniref:DUF7870 domain-containing protein n=1 Tax=Salvia splendens TaxID=180675 RepID=A0A8X8Y7T2_SALSN|nr:hypothetical protein SASPL_111932 [Salvia splendens]